MFGEEPEDDMTPDGGENPEPAVQNPEPAEQEAPEPDPTVENPGDAFDADGEPIRVQEDADPWAEFKDPHGKLFGRYDTPEAALKAFREVDQERGRLANELGQYRQQAQQPPPPETGPDPAQLATLLRVPPAKNLSDQTFIAAGEALDVQWNVDESGYVLTNDPANLANAQFVREQIGSYVQQEAMRAQSVERQQQQAMETARSEFLATHADVAPWADVLLDPAAAAVNESGRTFGSKAEYDAAVADQMRQMLAGRGVSLAHATASAPAQKPIPRSPLSPTGGPSTPPVQPQPARSANWWE